jgi:AcrR family transcriptional regulator
MPRLPNNRDDPALRHAQILQAAIELIGERGYYGFTVQDLAERCDLSKAGILYYYPSKDAVLIGVLSELERREGQAIGPLLDAAELSQDDLHARADVLAVLRAMVARASEQPQLCRLLTELMAESLNPSHPAHDWWRARDVALIEFLVKMIERFVARPHARARQLIAMMDGLCAHWLHAQGDFDYLTEWENALALLLPEISETGVASKSRP